MYQWLSEAIDRNSLIITASRRLARVLRSEYGQQQLAQGHKAWRSPDILFLDDWLMSMVNTASGDTPILLRDHSSSVIWERCLQGQAADQLLNITALVKQARQSWQRLNDWQVPLGEVSASARSQDEQLFASACRRYQATLTEQRWMDGAQLTEVARRLIASRTAAVPEKLVNAGFDRLTPAVEALFSTLQSLGCRISPAPIDVGDHDVNVRAFDNMDSEFRAAGAWARRRLAKDPAAMIGIISSSLDKNGAASERLVREGVAPGWQYGDQAHLTAVNTSYGRRLSEYPAIAIALILLQWLNRGLSFSEVSILLRTPFLIARETTGRCKLERYLRRLPDQQWTPATIVRLLKRRAEVADAAKWIEGIECLDSFQTNASGKATPAAWADRIDGLLSELGWPGARSLASDEFQLQNRWRELLNDLARLEIVCPKLSMSEACRRLAGLAQETVYQPESRAGAVQLLGPLEAAGMSFDNVWVAGLDADSWPPVAHPLTLISRQLQRQYGMPDSTPDDTLEYSRRVLQRLIGSATTVTLSWPRASEESENSASPLIAEYTNDKDEAPDPGWHARNLIGSHRLENPANDPVPAVQRDEIVAGGAYTVQRQISDPISAFAYGRLRVSDLDTVVTGLSPSSRGSVIHRVLHELFADKPAQDEIRLWDGAYVLERVSEAVDAGLKEYLWHADPVLKRLLTLERDRLHVLLRSFVEQELSRSSFVIEGVEHEVEIEQSGVRLKLRIDRIDRLADGSLLIADYKTGQPKSFLNRYGEPKDYQLVVYSQAIADIVGGLVLINIDSRSITYSGAAASGEWDAKRAEQWKERLIEWQSVVTRAMRQIAEGDVRINPNLPHERTRPLNILSRYQERMRARR